MAEKTVSNGCTEAEAMAAAGMVGRLLERYALSMEEIDVREERCVQIAVPIGGKQRRPIDGCVTAIARFCDCKVWISRDDATPSYIFFGFERTLPWPAICSRSLTCDADRACGIPDRPSSIRRRSFAPGVEELPARHSGTRRGSAR